MLRDPAIWALFILREDYLAPLDAYRRLLPTQLQNRYRIDRLTREMAIQAIERPVENYLAEIRARRRRNPCRQPRQGQNPTARRQLPRRTRSLRRTAPAPGRLLRPMGKAEAQRANDWPGQGRRHRRSALQLLRQRRRESRRPHREHRTTHPRMVPEQAHHPRRRPQPGPPRSHSKRRPRQLPHRETRRQLHRSRRATRRQPVVRTLPRPPRRADLAKQRSLVHRPPQQNPTACSAMGQRRPARRPAIPARRTSRCTAMGRRPRHQTHRGRRTIPLRLAAAGNEESSPR